MDKFMNILLSDKVALVITVLVIGVYASYIDNMLYILPLLIISILWILIFYKSKSAVKRNEIVFGRVDQLKNFSVELQVLINKELALVQEDVIRTRKIVSDSINILQDSTLEISNNVQVQQEQLEKLALALDKSDSSIKNIMGNVKDRDIGEVTDNIVSIVEGEYENIQSVEQSLLKNKTSIDNMMLALQFEDIVSQISERVAQHVGDIRTTVDILSRLCESELSTSFQQDIDKMKSEYMLMKEKMIKISSKNLASQKNMDEGDIELF